MKRETDQAAEIGDVKVLVLLAACKVHRIGIMHIIDADANSRNIIEPTHLLLHHHH